MKITRCLALISLSSLIILSLGDEAVSAVAEPVEKTDGAKKETTEPQALDAKARDAESNVVSDSEQGESKPSEQGESTPSGIGDDSVGTPSTETDAMSGSGEAAAEGDKTTKESGSDGGVPGNKTTEETSEEKASKHDAKEPPIQTGPFIDLLGESLLSLEMIDQKQAQLHSHYTNEALSGKKVVGLYFSADWCGPCRQFTPDLVNFYNKMNSRRGKENDFEIVWISRCRDFDSFGQYFTHMNWLALPPQDAMGQRGQMLSEKYKVKGIPTLVLLDEVGNVITTDGRNKIPMDKAGIGFPWRNPLSTVYMTVVPKSLRLMLKTQINLVREKLMKTIKGAIGVRTAVA